jgi:hypothetical protein
VTLTHLLWVTVVHCEEEQLQSVWDLLQVLTAL